ncbi:eukaryotic translation initiation factor 5-like [Pollicipes pollicipes]|uniref:eukaryotic translation initiation factor 5-like n=1 Tax=Pollicipes pollicipes TaxID=41117 RepID=UPI001884D244|nr:eukaryotic translation initiation factor 5-like [Pollicipes pollicipes]XP_037071971.1 eukaryotic translation initiation factor 5-like [Pollicipes pollicipes]
MALNVNTSVTDVFYRYKMPRLLAKVEGKGNGIKTVVVNMTEVAKALCRPPSYPCKYFGCELGAQTLMDGKNDRYIVNGAHDASKLQDMLDGFIRKFVLCPGCDNPETVLQVREKKGVIGQSCKACGYQGMLDMRHKLTTFILKNPPDADPTQSGKSLTKRAAKKGKKGKSNGDEKGSDHSEDGDEQLEGWSTDAPAAKPELDDWSVDVSEEAVQRRQAELTDGVKGLTINDDLEKAEKERLEIFYRYMLQRRDAGKLSGQEKSLLAEAERLDVKDKAPLVLSELLFNDTIVSQIGQHRVLLLRFTHDNKRAQKYLVGGLEQVINLYKDQLMPKVPHILKKLYDLDILDEEVLLEWGKKPSKKYVSKEVSEEIHAKAEKFINWLREAEEESDSDTEEDDDVEITYDDRAREIKEEKKAPPPAASTAAPQAEEHDDIDIDDI